MKRNRLLENLSQSVGYSIPTKRYNLADMISESYKMIYQCEENTNLKKLAESHLEDVRENPRDIERLSRQLSILKEVSKMVESKDLKDEDLVDKKYHDTVNPKKDRTIVKNECNECDDPKTPRESKRYTRRTKESCVSKKESIKEADDTELTDKELEELAKHLETIRKERKDAPKTEIKEDATPKRRGIRCSMTDSKKEKIDEEANKVYKYDIDIINSPDQNTKEMEGKISRVLQDADIRVVGCKLSETSRGMSESKKKKLDNCNESKSYRGLKNSKKCKSKTCKIKESKDPDYGLQNQIMEAISNAFYDVFKSRGLDAEDDALMQDFYCVVDIDSVVYDAAKFIESRSSKVSESTSYRGLENFKKQSESKAFYKTFKKMHRSLKEGKALTRQESIDLYKASNSALTQLSIELEHNPEFLDTFKESVSILSKDVRSLLESLTRGKAPSKKTMKSLSKFSESLLYESNEDSDEDIKIGSTVKILRGGRKGSLGKITDIQENDDEDVSELGEYTYEVTVEGDPEDKRYLSASDLEVVMKESYDPETSEGEEFVGDDEGDIEHEPSPEEEEYDQEYADGREELHQELADKHEDTEDEFVQDKLENDRVEVAVLKGEDPDEATAEDNIEDEPEDEEADDSDITDDELEELKKHLKEMRSARK